MFLVVAFGVAAPWHLSAGILVLGIVNAFNAPARQSILLELVGGKSDLPNAIALNSVMMNGARFVGPLIGGALIATLGERWSFGLNVVSYLVMLAALAQMRMPPRGHAPSEHDWRRELVAGARYAFGFFPARCALLLLAAVSITLGSYVALVPWFAREAFPRDSGTLGILIGAAGVGGGAGGSGEHTSEIPSQSK